MGDPSSPVAVDLNVVGDVLDSVRVLCGTTCTKTSADRGDHFQSRPRENCLFFLRLHGD